MTHEIRPVVSIDEARLTRRARQLAWEHLQEALTADLAEKLPPFVPLTYLSSMLSIETWEIREGTAAGTLVIAFVDGVRCMDTRHSVGFLTQRSRIRLPLPRRLRPTGGPGPETAEHHAGI